MNRSQQILVTGGGGFIGSAIVDRLIEEGHQVTIVDNLSTGKRANINKRAKFYRLDIRDRVSLKSLFAVSGFELISHHAAQSQVGESIREPVFDYEVNIEGFLNLLECGKDYRVKRFIFASSGGTIYGEPKHLPAGEDYPLFPQSPYAISKSAGELYLKIYQRSFGINYSILRYGNVYGPRQNPKGEAGVIAIFIGKILKGEKPTIFGDGENIRNYVYIDDIVEANILAMDKRENGIYNLGTGIGTSVNQIFTQLKRALSFEGEANYSSPRPAEIRKVYLKVRKAEKELGWRPTIKLEEGLKKTIAWFTSSRQPFGPRG